VRVEVLEDRQLLSTITVNTTGDDTTAGATLSLRQAIEVSDGTLSVSSLSTQEQAQVSGAVASTNTIDFNIPTTDPGYKAGVWTIAVNSALPSITTNAAIINGYSQPGASKNTLAQGDNAKLTIALSGPADNASLGYFNGLTIAQQGSQVYGLDIENFTDRAGVLITAGGNVQVAGCFLGTDPLGETATKFQSYGVEIENSSNMIGGPGVGDRNLMSGNLLDGVYVPDSATNPLNITPTGNVIENNIIGLDAAGTKSLGNQTGVEDNGSGNTYGGTTAGLGNVISGNGYAGIDFSGSITIDGNLVGTDATGEVAIGNGQIGGFGIVNNTTPSGTTIKSTISDNVVSGNDSGIYLAAPVGNAPSYTIAGNLIGTDASGTKSLGNTGTGIWFYGSVFNATVQDNVISGNGAGVETETGTQLQNIVLQGNLIGTDKTGLNPLGNVGYGIWIYSGSGITVGGSGQGQGNVIADSTYQGINVFSGQQNRFTHNSIFSNVGGGIADANSANHTPPDLTFAPATGGTGTLSGTLTDSPNTAYVVEIFSNPSLPATGYEQGKTFVQDVTLKTDATGKGSFSLTEPNGLYTATATDPNGSTSEFSNAVGVLGLPATATTVLSSQNPSTVGQPVTFTAVVTASGYQGTPTGTVTFTIDGQAQMPVSLALVGGSDQAQFTASTLSAGSHTVSASYSGDNNVSASSGSLPTEAVTAPGLQTTTTTLASSLDPSTVGQPVTFTAVVSPSGATGTPSGSVTFTIDGVSQAPVPLHVSRGSDQATLSIASLGKGGHTISAAYSGDPSFAASAVASPLVETVEAVIAPHPVVDGPKVELVQRFGIHMQPTVLVLSFNEALDLTSAVNPDNYRITDPAGRSVGIRSAVFNAETNTVTLRPVDRINLHHTYHLTVIGTGPDGVRSTTGLLLDGTYTETADSNYKGTLDWRNVVLTPAELKKYVHPKHAKPAGALSHHFHGSNRSSLR